MIAPHILRDYSPEHRAIILMKFKEAFIVMEALAHSEGARAYVAELAASLEAAANAVRNEEYEPDARKVSLTQVMHVKER